MVIDTDIIVKSDDGIEGSVQCHSPKELLNIMKLENIQECNVSASWLGQSIFSNKMTLKEVEKWINECESGI
jgi:hypothetical protein